MNVQTRNIEKKVTKKAFNDSSFIHYLYGLNTIVGKVQVNQEKNGKDSH